MKKFLLILTVLLAFFMPVNAKEVVIESLDSPEFMSSDGSFYSPSVTSYPKITQVEQSLYKKDFSSEPIEMRLKRLEQNLFKRTYDGYALSQRTDNILSSAADLTVDKSALSALEKAILSKNYNDTPSKRVSRMEQIVFGAVQSGDLNDRIQTLTTAAGSYSAYGASPQWAQQDTRGTRTKKDTSAQNFPQYQAYPNYDYPSYQAYESPQKKVKKPGKIKSGIGSVASFLVGGNPTGWTPQVDPSQWGSSIMDTNPTGYGYGGNTVQPYSPYSAPYNQFRNNGYTPQYNPYQANGQPMYQPQFPSLYGQNTQQPYQSPVQYQRTAAPQYMDLFSSGGSGSETYYDDGRYNRGFRNSGGGAAVTIIK